MKPRQFKSPSPDVSPTTELRALGAAEKLQKLLVVRGALLDKIAKQRAAEQRLVEKTKAVAAEFMGDVAPLVEECKKVDGQIHAVFEALLGEARRSKREKAKIRGLHRMLQEQGTLSFVESEEEGDVDPFVAPFVDAFFNGDPSLGGSGQESPTAERPLERSTIRGLFRRMAEALHPDKVQDEGERVYRTELMKEVTAAYHEGDLARLLDLERALKKGVSAGAPETAERRCEKVSEEIQELRAQLKQIERSLRALKRDPVLMMAGQFKKGAGAALVEEAREQAETLGKILDFVRSFQQGTIPLDEFLDGPDLGLEEEEEEDAMEMMIRALGISTFSDLPQKKAAKAKRKPR